MDKITAPELIDSLNGFEEIAIAKLFGADFEDLSGATMLRALVLVQERRDGAPDAQAFTRAMDLKRADLEDRFEDVTEEIDPDEPETEQGKGEPSPVGEPVPSPPSVSPPESSPTSTPA